MKSLLWLETFSPHSARQLFIVKLAILKRILLIWYDLVDRVPQLFLSSGENSFDFWCCGKSYHSKNNIYVSASHHSPPKTDNICCYNRHKFDSCIDQGILSLWHFKFWSIRMQCVPYKTEVIEPIENPKLSTFLVSLTLHLIHVITEHSNQKPHNSIGNLY